MSKRSETFLYIQVYVSGIANVLVTDNWAIFIYLFIKLFISNADIKSVQV